MKDDQAKHEHVQHVQDMSQKQLKADYTMSSLPAKKIRLDLLKRSRFSTPTFLVIAVLFVLLGTYFTTRILASLHP